MLPFILAATFFLAFSAELFAQSAGLIEAAKRKAAKSSPTALWNRKHSMHGQSGL